MLSSTRFIYGLSEQTQRLDKHIATTGTVAAISAPFIVANPTVGQQFLNIGMPIIADVEGFARVAMGLVDIGLALFEGDKNGNIYQARLLKGLWEGIKASPLIYYGLTGNPFMGYAINRSMELLDTFLNTPSYKGLLTSKNAADALECAGWWLVVAGNPLAGAVCLAGAAIYNLSQADKKKLSADLSSAWSTVFGSSKKTKDMTPPTSESDELDVNQDHSIKPAAITPLRTFK